MTLPKNWSERGSCETSPILITLVTKKHRTPYREGAFASGFLSIPTWSESNPEFASGIIQFFGRVLSKISGKAPIHFLERGLEHLRS